MSRLLFVHAHPDDETLATGGLIAALAASGADTFVLTGSRGEQGEIVPGSVPHGSDLDAHREAEVAAACAALGVRGQAFLGEPPARAEGLQPRRYTDSGMAWQDAAETVAGPGDAAGPDSLSLAAVQELAGDIAAYARFVDAELIIGYDETGGYGHPDHVALVAPSRAAASEVGVPFLEVAPDSAEDAWVIETPEQLERVQEALRHHASQVTVDGTDVVHVGGQRQTIQLRFLLRAPGDTGR